MIPRQRDRCKGSGARIPAGPMSTTCPTCGRTMMCVYIRFNDARIPVHKRTGGDTAPMPTTSVTR